MIRVLFFGRLRELLKCGVLELTAIQEPISLAKLRVELRKKGGDWEEFLSTQHALAAVNQDMADETVIVKTGDEVAFFPPVTGG
ncbi:MoaD/ThiS family protein [Vibrio sp.]|uniref:Molybdopterin synthase sulfur carrier subunit n=1 Tax=Vibrio viridaestus TaxID=2487322 RepID=A0A3N9U1Q6_9VIBR|nr:MoaD/ThiS family protein [Vibrio viridaestus]MDC0611447.1 MoaD/ThiS family protein [Vibrio sp.]RQW61856.1 molybdopterin synthase sulfur carrier subunit [Vibrio viridaestus]